jgi:SAM-dependent methyltransferase
MSGEDPGFTLLLTKPSEVEGAKRWLESLDKDGCVWEILERSARMRAQHPARVWEYAHAIRAAVKWLAGHYDQDGDTFELPTIWDVGGAGSPFAWIAAESLKAPVRIIDPLEDGMDLDEAEDRATVRPDIIVSISTIEHVQDQDKFLETMCQVLNPGGLIFLTTDFAPEFLIANGDIDTYMFSHMRARIYGPDTWPIDPPPGFEWFGGPGNIAEYAREMALSRAETPVYNYTFASLAWRKTR